MTAQRSPSQFAAGPTSNPPVTVGRHGPWSVGNGLGQELVSRWHCWFLSRRGRRTVAAWALAHPALRNWTADELAAPVGGPVTDEMQAALIIEAQAGDVDAAMTLLVQFRPGLLSLLRSRLASGNPWPPAELANEIKACFFETLLCHRTDRRPTKIAANLLLDTRHRLRTTDRQHTSAVSQSPHVETVDNGGEDSEADMVATLHSLRSTLDRLPGSTASRRFSAAVAYRAWVLDEPQKQIAADLKVDPELVSTRLHRIRQAVRAADLAP